MEVGLESAAHDIVFALTSVRKTAVGCAAIVVRATREHLPCGEEGCGKSFAIESSLRCIVRALVKDFITWKAAILTATFYSH